MSGPANLRHSARHRHSGLLLHATHQSDDVGGITGRPAQAARERPIKDVGSQQPVAIDVDHPSVTSPSSAGTSGPHTEVQGDRSRAIEAGHDRVLAVGPPAVVVVAEGRRHCSHQHPGLTTMVGKGAVLDHHVEPVALVVAAIVVADDLDDVARTQDPEPCPSQALCMGSRPVVLPVRPQWRRRSPCGASTWGSAGHSPGALAGPCRQMRHHV